MLSQVQNEIGPRWYGMVPYYPLQGSENSVRIFCHQHLDTIVSKKNRRPCDSATPKKRIQTAITKSVFDRQHSCWHRLEAATTAHPAILTLLVSTPYIGSSCLPSAAEVAWKFLFWAICRPHTLSTSSPFTHNQHLQSKYPLSPIDLRLRKFGRSSPF